MPRGEAVHDKVGSAGLEANMLSIIQDKRNFTDVPP